MFYRAIKALAEVLSICSISAGAFSQCSVDVVIVNGRVEHAPRKGIVRVQLVYPKQKQKLGESGEVTVEGGSFRIQIPFLTQSRAPGLLGVREKCDRKPETVVVTLMEGDQEYDRVSLDLAKDFKMADPSAYALRSEILLHGPPSTPPIRYVGAETPVNSCWPAAELRVPPSTVDTEVVHHEYKPLFLRSVSTGNRMPGRSGA